MKYYVFIKGLNEEACGSRHWHLALFLSLHDCFDSGMEPHGSHFELLNFEFLPIKVQLKWDGASLSEDVA